MLDAVLAWVHFACIFGLVGCLFAEAFFYRQVIPATTFERLRGVDRWYGIMAGAVVVSGILRVTFSPKTPSYYMHDWIFWTKIALFVVVGLLSIPPTIHYLRSAAYAEPDGTVRIPAAVYGRTRLLLNVQVGLLFLIPLCASFMAHGFGYR